MPSTYQPMQATTAEAQELLMDKEKTLTFETTQESEWCPPPECILPAELASDDALVAYFARHYGLLSRPMPHQLRGIRQLMEYKSKRLLLWPPRAGKTLAAVLSALLRISLAPEYEGARCGRLVFVATPNTEVASISWDDTCMKAFFRNFSDVADVHVVHHRSDLLNAATWKSAAEQRGVNTLVLCAYHHWRDHWKDVATGAAPHLVGCSRYDSALCDRLKRDVESADTLVAAWGVLQRVFDSIELPTAPLVDIVILDEVQRCLSVTSQTGVAFRLLLSSVPPHCRFFLSGTPAGNRPHEDRAGMCQLASAGARTWGVAPNNVHLGCEPFFWDPTTCPRYPDQLRPEARAMIREMDCSAKESDVFQVRGGGTKLRRVKPDKTVECVALTQAEWEHYLCAEHEVCQKARLGLAASRRSQGSRRNAAATSYIAGVARLEYGFVSAVASKPEFVQCLRERWASPTFPEHKALRPGGSPRCHNPDCLGAGCEVFNVQYSTCVDLKANHYLCDDCVALRPPTCPRCDDILAACRTPGCSSLRTWRMGNIIVPTTSLMAHVLRLLHAHLRTPKTGKVIVTLPRKADAVECMLLIERHHTLPAGRTAVIFDGDVDGIKTLRTFKECDAVRVMLAVPEKICEGLDLSVANLLIKTTVQWCQAKDEQLNARITGHMQTRKPRVVQLVVPGTICEAKLWNNEGCARLSRAVLGGETNGALDFCRALGHLNLIIAARPNGISTALVLKEARTRSERMDDVLMDLEDHVRSDADEGA
jgi:hypothetical protein